jgi:hypothetical protein
VPDTLACQVSACPPVLLTVIGVAVPLHSRATLVGLTANLAGVGPGVGVAVGAGGEGVGLAPGAGAGVLGPGLALVVGLAPTLVLAVTAWPRFAPTLAVALGRVVLPAAGGRSVRVSTSAPPMVSRTSPATSTSTQFCARRRHTPWSNRMPSQPDDGVVASTTQWASGILTGCSGW